MEVGVKKTLEEFGMVMQPCGFDFLGAINQIKQDNTNIPENDSVNQSIANKSKKGQYSDKISLKQKQKSINQQLINQMTI